MIPKITLADAIRIRVQVKRGRSQDDLAREYGITPGNVSMIVNRKTHNHGLAAQLRKPKRKDRRNDGGWN